MLLMTSWGPCLYDKFWSKALTELVRTFLVIPSHFKINISQKN